MKQIVKEFGNFFLSAAVLITIFSMLRYGMRDAYGRTGVFQIMGTMLPVNAVQQESHVGFSVYQEECQKPMPAITWKSNEMLYAKEKIFLNQFLEAKDGAGTSLKIHVLKIRDTMGTDITEECLQENGRALYFLKAGNYHVWVSARDTSNKRIVCHISVPINAR